MNWRNLLHHQRSLSAGLSANLAAFTMADRSWSLRLITSRCHARRASSSASSSK